MKNFVISLASICLAASPAAAKHHAGGHAGHKCEKTEDGKMKCCKKDKDGKMKCHMMDHSKMDHSKMGHGDHQGHENHKMEKPQ